MRSGGYAKTAKLHLTGAEKGSTRKLVAELESER